MNQETARKAYEMLCRLWAEQHGYEIVIKEDKEDAA